MSARDGGPAFPVNAGDNADLQYYGLTARDWFAGQAIAGFLSNVSKSDTAEIIADAAYRIADAMLAERDK